MARTTAPHGRAAGNDRCRECLSHTLAYLLTDGVTVTPDPEANVALCACNRFIGHGGRAAHACTAVGA